MRRISSWTCSQSTWWQTQTPSAAPLPTRLRLPPGALAFDHILKQTASFFFLATMANVVDLVSGQSLFVPDARQTVRLSELLSEADWEIRVFVQIVPWLLETSKSQCFSTLEVLDTRPRSLRSLHGAYRWRQNEAEQPVEEKKSTSVLPSCCKSRWHSPPKSYLVVLSALCCQNVFAVWKLDKRRWGGLTGTWHVQVLSCTGQWTRGLGRATCQWGLLIVMSVSKCFKCPTNVPFGFMYTLPMCSSWRSDCYGYFLPWRPDLVEPCLLHPFCFLLFQSAAHFESSCLRPRWSLRR